MNAAHAAGMDALLVLTGVTSGIDGSAWARPEHVLPSLAELADIFGKKQRASSS
jgi:ribonucleotide monophosphatase NagD (HAD superfamily)